MPSFNEQDLPRLCDALAAEDPVLQRILHQYGYPPFWSRKPGFETLVHIILEQQVSLASARSALTRLQQKTKRVTPAAVLALSDEELRACYFSRQKAAYARHLAEAFQSKHISISRLAKQPDEAIRETLISIKGIGHWTVDVFMMMSLHRTDLFPTGDIALMNSVRHEMALPHASKEEILLIGERWRPNRTIAAFLFWHAYIKRKNLRY